MLEILVCRALAEQRLVQLSVQCDADLVMLCHIAEHGITVAFFYQSDEYVKTGNSLAALAGNGPILVNRTTGVVGTAGTAMPLEEYVRDFEARTTSV